MTCIVAGRVGREVIQRKMRYLWGRECQLLCMAQAAFAVSILRMRRVSASGRTRPRMYLKASEPDCAHSIPGKALAQTLDSEKSVTHRRLVARLKRAGQEDFSRKRTGPGMMSG
jgi:hypothetical protein